MPNFEEASTPRDKAIALISVEIARAENDRAPTSRQRLTQLVITTLHMPPRDATQIVDSYCDTDAPSVPHYLQEEFTNPYLWIMASINTILGIGCLLWAANRWQSRQPSGILFILAAVLILAACLAWFKTVQQRMAKTTS